MKADKTEKAGQKKANQKRRVEPGKIGVPCQVLIFLAVFALFSVALTNFDPNLRKRTTTEISLFDYDTAVFAGQDACFTYLAASGEEYAENMWIDVNEKPIEKAEIYFHPGENKTYDKCVNGSLLDAGDNAIRVTIGAQNLFFHVRKEAGLPLKPASPGVLLKDSKNNIAIFSVKNGEYKGRSILVSIYGGGKLDHSVRVELSPLEEKTVSENYSLGGRISVDFAKPFEQKFAEPSNKNILLMFLASVLLFLPGFLFVRNRIPDGNLAALIALSIGISIVILVSISWVSSYAGLPKELPIFSSVLLCLVALVQKGKSAICWKPQNKTLLVIAFFTLFSTFSQFLLPSHDSMWSVYYERQADLVYGAGKIPQSDPLSYLGRDFTFVPGYMLLRAAYSWGALAAPADSFFVFQMLGNIFFVSSALFLCSKLRLKLKESFVFLMFLFSSSFVFGWSIISLLHLFGFSLFLIAIALALEGNWFAGLFAGFSGIFHASFLFAFPVILFIFMRQGNENLKSIGKYSALMLLVFFLLYSPFLFKHGLPSEIQGKNWGYFITGNIIDLGTNTAGIMSFAILPAILCGLRKEKKLALLTLLFIFAFFFVSYRVNVFLGLTAALLFVRVFGTQNFSALCLLFLASFLLNIWVYQGVIGAEMEDPFLYLSANTATGSRLLVEPLYGHISNYFSERKSLADLYVEYASDEKYNDAVNFISTGDESVLKKWNISYAVTVKRSRALAVNKYVEPKREIVYPGLDKIYDDGLLNIHYFKSGQP